MTADLGEPREDRAGGQFCVVPRTWGQDRYQHLKEIGRGGQGTVELARDRWSGGLVVVKCAWWRRAELDPEQAANQRARRDQALSESIKIHAELTNHTQAVPSIIDVVEQRSVTRVAHGTLSHDDEADRESYLITQFIGTREGESRTLREYVRDGGDLDPATALALADQVAAVLGALHTHRRVPGTGASNRRGAAGYYYVHSDLKPDNILVSGHPPRFTLIDFGAARKVEVNGTAKVRGHTPGYSPPDEDEPLSAKFDMYSLAATLFYALTGQDPPPTGLTQGSADLAVTGLLTRMRIHPTLRRLVTDRLWANPNVRPADVDLLRNEIAAARTALARVQALPGLGDSA